MVMTKNKYTNIYMRVWISMLQQRQHHHQPHHQLQLSFKLPQIILNTPFLSVRVTLAIIYIVRLYIYFYTYLD